MKAEFQDAKTEQKNLRDRVVRLETIASAVAISFGIVSGLVTLYEKVLK